MNKLNFLNHASCIAETHSPLLIVDLWVEGYSADKGL